MSLVKEVRKVFETAARNRLFQHLCFWAMVIAGFIVAKGSFQLVPSANLVPIIALGLLFPIIASYFLNYFLIPRFLVKNRFLLFLILAFLSTYIFSSLARLTVVHLAEPFVRAGEFGQESVYEIFMDFPYLLKNYVPTIFLVSFLLFFVKQQKIKKAAVRKNLLLEKEKAEAELNFLKSQIHPHFLFNTLNSLYMLCLKKSEKAPEMIIRLSEILEYILYKGKEKLVPLKKEIRLLENYVALEKLRFGEDLELNFEKDVDHYDAEISPLLLLTLVENAFKHGACGSAEQRIVSISLEVKSGELIFEVYNTRDKVENQAQTKRRKGIGLSNLQEQLSIFYEEFDIEIESLENDYRVKMWINLGSSIAHISGPSKTASDDSFLENRQSAYISAN